MGTRKGTCCPEREGQIDMRLGHPDLEDTGRPHHYELLDAKGPIP